MRTEYFGLMNSLGSNTAESMGIAVSRFQQRLLLIFGAVVLIGSAMENDRRGLLLWDAPEALTASLPAYDEAASSVIDYTNSYPANLSFGTTPSRQLRRVRSVPGRQSAPAAAAIDSAPGIAGAAGAPLEPAAAAAAPVTDVAQATPATAAPNIATGQLPPSSGPGFSPSPIGASQLIPVVVVAPPVVPAIPEPSSWILMILGIGILGEVLRRSRRRTAVGDFGLVPA